jgi:hypothetical protein
MLVGIPGVFLAISLAAFGAAALGSDILAPAYEAIELYMPDDAKDTSGVIGVLDGVAERLDGIASGEFGVPDDVELPDDAEIPTELPPEDAEIEGELPAESETGLDTAESFLDSVAS